MMTVKPLSYHDVIPSLDLGSPDRVSLRTIERLGGTIL